MTKIIKVEGFYSGLKPTIFQGVFPLVINAEFITSIVEWKVFFVTDFWTKQVAILEYNPESDLQNIRTKIKIETDKEIEEKNLTILLMKGDLRNIYCFESIESLINRINS